MFGFNIFSFSKKKENNEREFVFVWYKKMFSGNDTYYTKPHRTKIKAIDYDEAKDKLTDFILNKMEIVIIDEEEFDDSDFIEFSEIRKKFDDAENSLKNTFSNW